MSALAKAKANELVDGLEGVTPGPWTWGMKFVSRPPDDGTITYEKLCMTPDAKVAEEGSQWEMNAAHIARCSPDNIRLICEAIEAQAAELERVKAERDELQNLADRLKMEARIHSGEARAANASLNDAYQAASGAKGERGNWNGANPIKEALAAAEARALAAESALSERTRAEAWPIVKQLGAHEKDFHNLVKSFMARHDLNEINTICKEVIAARALSAPNQGGQDA